MAIDHGPKGAPRDERPETRYPDVVLEDAQGPGPKAVAAVGGAIAGGALVWGLKRRLG
jgi:hypothetical protein